MVEIHNIENSSYKRYGWKTFDSGFEDGNNRRMRELWNMLAIISLGTLTPEFNKLYWYGGAFHPAYDINSKLGNYPPTATIHASSNPVELLLPVYRSMNHRDRVRPATLGIYAHKAQKTEAQVFVKNFEYLTQPLETQEVYAVMKRPDDSPYTSKYENPDKFRSDYYKVITGEEGEVIVVTNNPHEALQSYKRLQVEKDLNKVASNELQVSATLKVLPRFLQTIFIRRLANHNYVRIEDTLT